MADGLFEQLNVLEKVVAVAGSVGLAFTTWTAANIKNDVDAQKGKIERLGDLQELEIQARKDARDADRQTNELTKMIFDEFVKAIMDKESTEPQRFDRLTGVLALTYAIPDAAQKERMANAVQQSVERLQPGANGVKAEQLAAARFDAEELVTQASGEQRDAPPQSAAATSASEVSWSNYDFDVFFCDGVTGSDELRAQAERVTALKGLDKKASGRWRVRSLPANVNLRSGYRVVGSQIRYSSNDERELAEQLKKKAIDAGISDVQVRPTSMNTPWYLSVFVCPAQLQQ